MNRCFLLIAVTLLALPLTAQLSVEEVDLDRISPKTVCTLFEQFQATDSIQYLSDLHSYCCQNPDQYFYHEQEIKVDADPDSLWKCYKSTNPGMAWNGKRVGFGLLYSHAADQVSYADDDFEGMKEGQVIFIGLRLLGGLIKLPVALEVTRVDDQERILEYCYIGGCGKSEGTQQVHLLAGPDGTTRIQHLTWYRSESGFRDRNFYPYFHSKAILEFHKNIEKVFFRSHRR